MAQAEIYTFFHVVLDRMITQISKKLLITMPVPFYSNDKKMLFFFLLIHFIYIVSQELLQIKTWLMHD